MTGSRTFTSYTTPYDHYVGERDVSELHRDEADRLIRAVFEPAGEDFRELVTRWNVKKAQVEGLWFLVVQIGLRLERTRRMADFEERTADDIQNIIAVLDGSRLWLRVEEAFPPFDNLMTRTDYDWSELEGLDEELDHYLDQTIRSVINDGLLAPSRVEEEEFVDRLSWADFKSPQSAKYNLVVDKAMAYRVAQSGRLKRDGVGPLVSLLSPVILVGSIPVMIWGNLWAGLAMIPLAIFGFRWSAARLRLSVHKLAISNRDDYRWLLSRRAIWLVNRFRFQGR